MQKTPSSTLEEAFENLIAMLSSLSEEELNTVPYPGSWTAAQVANHLNQSYNVAGCLTGQTAPTERDPGLYIAPVSEEFLNFDTKMQSPDFILPQEGHIKKDTLMNSLRQQVSAITDYARSDADMTLTCLDFEFPGAGPLTRQEWLNFVRVHTLRHNHQLKGIINKLQEKAGRE